MIRELGNVEHFELCEIVPKYIVLIVFFIGSKDCGQFLFHIECRRKFYKLRFDALYPALRNQEGAIHGARRGENWGTNRAFRGPQRAEEMHQK